MFNLNLKKINEFTWQIEKSGNMKVPATIYASEILLNKIKEDKTLEQLNNMACLKGILKSAYAMPDAHQGYGFPIGGVAAFDMEEGILSPGGVGYDINCLTSDSKILTEYGYTKKIKEFEKSFVEIENAHPAYSLKSIKKIQRIISFNPAQKCFSSRNSLYFMKKRHIGSIYEIKTKLGYKLKLTAEHPILTKNGMNPVEIVKENQEVAVNPFEGVGFEDILNDFNILQNHKFSDEQKSELRNRNLYPLKLSNVNLPIIAKLFGYLLGDGNIYFSNNKGRLCAYGSKEDLEEMKSDFSKIGFSARVYSREREHNIITQYGENKFKTTNHELHVSSSSLANLFYHLGYPKGAKSSTESYIPEWIKKSPIHIKRLFLAGLFGAELSSPSTHSKTGFYCPIFSQNKLESLLDNSRVFCIEIMKLLEEFGVKINKISDRKEFVNKEGKTYRVRLVISGEENNLLRLWTRIGFEYNFKRKKISQIASLYIKEKKYLTKKRTKIAEKAKELKKKGLRLKEIQKLLGCSYANDRFIERHFYEKAGQRLPLDFLSFDDFKEMKLKELNRSGLFFDSIKSIEKKEFNGEVYDLNIEKTHNFIANNIVVSNCGVRLLKTDLKSDDILSKRKQLLEEIYKQVPSGVGKGGITKVNNDILLEVLEKGSEWAVSEGYGTKDDSQRTEEYGRMKTDPGMVSEKALKRGRPQLGTLGAGNHFLEMQKVDKIYDEAIAKKFGVNEEGQVMVMIHCGSRGLGHQVASDYIRKMEEKYGIEHLPDRELINAPIQSQLGQDYYKAMCAAVNFAFVNRQMIAHWTREVFEKVFGSKEGMDQVYDVCHNLAKFENHIVDDEKREVCVHRKGATRSFGPGRAEIPEVYQDVGQPVIIPGSMGTASYLLVGTRTAEEISFGSTAHGAGRVGSRASARNIRGEDVVKDLSEKGIVVKGSWKGIAEEAPQMYKDIDEVVKVSNSQGLGKIVARLVPLAVMKG